MKKILLILFTLCSFVCFGQLRISDMPTTTNPAGAYVPVVKSGFNYKLNLDSIATKKVDSIKVINDSLFYYRYGNGIKVFAGLSGGGGAGYSDGYGLYIASSTRKVDTTQIMTRDRAKKIVDSTKHLITLNDVLTNGNSTALNIASTGNIVAAAIQGSSLTAVSGGLNVQSGSSFFSGDVTLNTGHFLKFNDPTNSAYYSVYNSGDGVALQNNGSTDQIASLNTSLLSQASVFFFPNLTGSPSDTLATRGWARSVFSTGGSVGSFQSYYLGNDQKTGYDSILHYPNDSTTLAKSVQHAAGWGVGIVKAITDSSRGYTYSVDSFSVGSRAYILKVADSVHALGGTGSGNYINNQRTYQTDAAAYVKQLTVKDTLTGMGGISIIPFSGGTWIDMPTSGPSALGSGGAGFNAWVANVTSAGQYIPNAASADIIYRNIYGRQLWGTSATAYAGMILDSNTLYLRKAPVISTISQVYDTTSKPLVIDASGNVKKGYWFSGGGGSGTVTNFSAGDLSPLFTTSEATTTTTPALTFSLSNAAATSIFGNFTNASAAPSYNAASADGQLLVRRSGALTFGALVAGDIPDISSTYIKNQTSQQSSSNFNISGAGVIGTTLNINAPALTTGTLNSKKGTNSAAFLAESPYNEIGFWNSDAAGNNQIQIKPTDMYLYTAIGLGNYTIHSRGDLFIKTDNAADDITFQPNAVSQLTLTPSSVKFNALNGTGNRLPVLDLNGVMTRGTVDPANIGLLNGTNTWIGTNTYTTKLLANGGLQAGPYDISTEALVTTTNTTQTVVANIDPTNEATGILEIDVVGVKSDMSASIVGKKYFLWRKTANSVSFTSLLDVPSVAETGVSGSSWNIAGNADGHSIDVKVTGLASTTIKWQCAYKIQTYKP